MHIALILSIVPVGILIWLLAIVVDESLVRAGYQGIHNLLLFPLAWLKSLFSLGPSAQEEIKREQKIIDDKLVSKRLVSEISRLCDPTIVFKIEKAHESGIHYEHRGKHL